MKIKINFTKVVSFMVLTFFSVQLFASDQSSINFNDQGLWTGIALVVSEIASLMSKKYTGIVQGLFMVVKSLFASKKK